MSTASPQPRARVLVVEDEAGLRRIAQYRLEEAGYEVVLAADGREGLARFDEVQPDLVLTDVRMPGLDGEALMDQVLARVAGLPVVVMTGHGTVQSAVAAMQRGAADYVTKPVSWDEMLLVVQRALDHAALRRDNQRLREALADRVRFEGVLGDSDAMRAVFLVMHRLKDVDTTVLLTGESGTGKEVVAKALHFQGARAAGPFVAVNCGAIPAELLESQLFGHEKGAFTGATRTHRGFFEQAHGGTLFLDEVGEIPLPAQVALLRALTERRIQRVGGEETLPVDVRLIAATNRDLAAAVEEGEFRQDLYYRLAVVPLRLPPLRDRRGDVEPLAEAFASRITGRPVRLSRGAADVLRSHRWPGNVRELENAVERIVVLHEVGDTILPEHLPPGILEPAGTVLRPRTGDFPEEGVDLAAIEREWIERALTRTHGNRTRAAQLLGITRQTLLYRIEKHGIEIPPP